MSVDNQHVVAVDRCVYEIRQGRPVLIETATGALVVAALEADLDDIAGLAADNDAGRLVLLLTTHRARALRLGSAPLAFPVPADMDAVALRRLAMGSPLPEERAALGASAHWIGQDEAAAAAFYLGRLAETVPAFLAFRLETGTAEAFAQANGLLRMSVEAIRGYRHSSLSEIKRLSTANVPLPQSEEVRFVAYRSRDALADHIAVVMGDPASVDAPLVRLHSACLTGDIFHSLRCDCGEQLETTLALMRERGAGIVCYLAQEGRGIGIANKLRAYALQDGGLDTLEANEALGFAADEREFAIAARMLEDLGVSQVRLVTNNPDKIGRLAACGLDVVERVPLGATLNPYNERYINARVEKSGYLYAVGS